MAYRKLGDIPVGEIVKLKEKGAPVNYIVVHQGLPSSIYDASCDGTWLLRQDIAENKSWGDERENTLETSKIHTYLNDTWWKRYDSAIISRLQDVKIPYRQGGGIDGIDRHGSDGLPCEIFLLSAREVGITPATTDEGLPYDGDKLSYFDIGNTASGKQKRVAKFNGSEDAWWLRSPGTEFTIDSWVVRKTGLCEVSSSSNLYGVRPALILPSSLWVVDDGNVVVNNAPIAPSSIIVPATIKGGANVAISWAKAIDADTNLRGYELERRWDNTGAWMQIYKGSALSYQDSIPKGAHTSVAYRVRAYDSYNAYSGYTTSPNRTIINNDPPTISGSDSNLGSFAMAPPSAWGYTVNDVDAGDTITVTEAVDGVTKRTFTATRGQQYSFGWTADEWMQVLNGTHTATITANDGQGGKAVRTLTFSKSVTRIEFYLDPPLETDTMPTKALENVVRAIPAGATLCIEICNNGFDAAPTWEDVTAKVISGDKIFLRNTTKTAEKWGYGIHVIVERNGASGECWVSSGAGFFE